MEKKVFLCIAMERERGKKNLVWLGDNMAGVKEECENIREK